MICWFNPDLLMEFLLFRSLRRWRSHKHIDLQSHVPFPLQHPDPVESGLPLPKSVTISSMDSIWKGCKLVLWGRCITSKRACLIFLFLWCRCSCTLFRAFKYTRLGLISNKSISSFSSEIGMTTLANIRLLYALLYAFLFALLCAHLFAHLCARLCAHHGQQRPNSVRQRQLPQGTQDASHQRQSLWVCKIAVGCCSDTFKFEVCK